MDVEARHAGPLGRSLNRLPQGVLRALLGGRGLLSLLAGACAFVVAGAVALVGRRCPLCVTLGGVGGSAEHEVAVRLALEERQQGGLRLGVEQDRAPLAPVGGFVVLDLEQPDRGPVRSRSPTRMVLISLNRVPVKR